MEITRVCHGDRCENNPNFGIDYFSIKPEAEAHIFGPFFRLDELNIKFGTADKASLRICSDVYHGSETSVELVIGDKSFHFNFDPYDGELYEKSVD